MCRSTPPIRCSGSATGCVTDATESHALPERDPRSSRGSRFRVPGYRRVTELAWSFMLPSDDALTA